MVYTTSPFLEHRLALVFNFGTNDAQTKDSTIVWSMMDYNTQLGDNTFEVLFFDLIGGSSGKVMLDWGEKKKS